MLEPIVSHGLPGSSQAMILSLGCVLLTSKTCRVNSYIFSISSLIFNQHINLHAYRHVSSTPVWLLWSCSKAFCWGKVTATTLLPFSTILPIIARSPWNVQHICISCFTSASVNGQLFILYAVSVHHLVSGPVFLFIVMHCGISVQDSIELMPRFIVGISLSLLPQWFYHDSQFTA